ncbi:MAG: T9SS type B sorting domain-containing protein, partial [Bacteroidota bacterium]
PYRSSKFGLPNFIQNFFGQNITFENLCFGETSFFKLINYTEVESVQWNFGESSSSVSNELEPTHVYSSPGSYEVSATILYANGSEKVVSRALEITEIPTAFPIEDIYVCAEPNSSYSNWTSSFPADHVLAEVLQGQEDMRVTFDEGYSAEFGQPISELGNSSVFTQEIITVRVARKNNPLCYDETTFLVVVNDGGTTYSIDDLYACDSDNDGFAEFDLSAIITLVNGGQTDIEVTFYDINNNEIFPSNEGTYINTIPYNQTLTVRINDIGNQCVQEESFNLITESITILHTIYPIIACDDNGDGISEYFDTSNIEEQLLNGQSGISLSYFNQDGIELSNPLPNPYTNTTPFNDLITVRLTDEETLCFTETVIELKTVTEPIINQPANLFACDTGNGFGEFDTTNLVEQIIGNQTGLEVLFYDTNNNPLPSPLPAIFINSEPYSQTIIARVEDSNNPLCYSETYFDLVVNELPVIDLEEDYLICNLEPSLWLSIRNGYSDYAWTNSNGDIISTSHTAEIFDEGDYTLTVTQTENGIECFETFNFSLSRSVLPQIESVNFGELGNNFIKIIASGDGEFEYSIDGVFYQDSNYFSNISGGIYNVVVRDKNGCGESTKEVAVVDFPKFFTPNSDGINDTWEIKGIRNFHDFEVLIFDRYGRILQRLDASNLNWNGRYEGDFLKSDDYWFQADLGNGKTFSGHFALRR